MKKIISFLFAMSSIMSFAQQLDGYNCIFLNSHTNNQWGLDDRIKSSFIEKGFKVVTSQDEISKKPNERLATLELTYNFEIKYGGTPFNFKLVNMLGEKVFEAEGVGNTMSACTIGSPNDPVATTAENGEDGPYYLAVLIAYQLTAKS